MNVLELEVRPRRKRAAKRSRSPEPVAASVRRRKSRKAIKDPPADVPMWREIRDKAEEVKKQLRDEFEADRGAILVKIKALELSLQYTTIQVQRQRLQKEIEHLKNQIEVGRLDDKFKEIDDTAAKVERAIISGPNTMGPAAPNASKQDRRVIRSLEVERSHNVTEELSRSGKVPQTEIERKRDLMDRFVMKINPQAPPPIYVLHADFCDDCGISMRIIAKDSLLGCPKCHKVRVFLQSANSVSAQTLQSDSASGTGTATGTGTASSSNVFTSASSWWDLRRSVFSSFVNMTTPMPVGAAARHDKLNPTKTWMEQSMKFTMAPSDTVVPSVHSSMHEDALLQRVLDLEGRGPCFETFGATAGAWFRVLIENMKDIQVESFDWIRGLSWSDVLRSDELKHRWWRATRKFNEKFWRTLVKTSDSVDCLRWSHDHGGIKFWNEEKTIIALMLLRGRGPPRLTEAHKKVLAERYRTWFAKGESIWGKPAVLFEYDFILRKFLDMFELDSEKALVSTTTQISKKLEPYWQMLCA